MKNIKIAIIYDWIDSWGGAERVILTLLNLFKNADLYTSYYDRDKARWAKNFKINTTFIQKLPSFIKKNRILSILLYPYAFESIDLKKYDFVFSVTSSFAKSVITKPDCIHICYMFTPTRYFWIDKKSYYKNPIIRSVSNIYLEKFKKWDYMASQRPDKIISISNFVKKSIKKYYKRNSIIIYPPFDIAYWEKVKKTIKFDSSNLQSFFLLVSRLEYYKQVEIAIRAFNKLGEKLIIIGKGSQKKNLQKMAHKNIEFKQDLSDQELAVLYTKAEALIMPQVEEFGMVSLEAQFFGCPVITFNKGGTTETVIQNKTGIFFNKQEPEDIIKAIVRYKSMSYNLKKSIKALGKDHFLKFEEQFFIEKLKNFIRTTINK